MDFEYVALLYWTGLPKEDEEFTRNFGEHLGQGWKEYIRASWPRQKRSISTGGACIMRRPKDEPRKCSLSRCSPDEWPCERVADLKKSFQVVANIAEAAQTKVAELQELIAHDKELVKSIVEDAQTEAGMQTAWNKDLLKRNEELQAAIDEVVTISKQPRPHGAVHRLLWPLTTKKEDGNEPIQD